jgi:hypothetical protein
MNFENVCLAILTLQGFIFLWLEWQVYVIHSDRFKERAAWREQKRRQQERKINAAGEAATGPIPFNGNNVADDIQLPEGTVRNLPSANEKA